MKLDDILIAAIILAAVAIVGMTTVTFALIMTYGGTI